MMEDPILSRAVDSIYETDPSIEKDAYFFLQETLEFLMDRLEQKEGRVRHMDAEEILNGFTELAWKKFGVMAGTIFTLWGVHKSHHVGEMVFRLIHAGIFQKQPSDRLEDFDCWKCPLSQKMLKYL